MKKLLFFFLLLGCSAFSQKSPYSVYLGCYTGGDTIPDDGLKVETYSPNGPVPHLFNLSLLKDGVGQAEAGINTWEIVVYYRAGNSFIIKQMPGSPSIDNIGKITARDDLRPQKIVIENITISVKENGQTITQKLPSETLYRAAKNSKNYK